MAKQKTDNDLLNEINSKLDLLVLVTSLNGKDKKEQKRILKNYEGSVSKRDLERITGIDRHGF